MNHPRKSLFEIFPSRCSLFFCSQAAHELDRKTTSRTFPVSMETTATIPSRADQPQLFQDPSIETPASTTCPSTVHRRCCYRHLRPNRHFPTCTSSLAAQRSGVLFREVCGKFNSLRMCSPRDIAHWSREIQNT